MNPLVRVHRIEQCGLMGPGSTATHVHPTDHAFARKDDGAAGRSLFKRVMTEAQALDCRDAPWRRRWLLCPAGSMNERGPREEDPDHSASSVQTDFSEPP